MRTRFCDECKVIPAKFALRKGEEVSYLCEPSFKEALLGLVTSNDTLIFAEVGDMKARSLVSNAILWKRLSPQRANPPGHGLFLFPPAPGCHCLSTASLKKKAECQPDRGALLHVILQLLPDVVERGLKVSSVGSGSFISIWQSRRLEIIIDGLGHLPPERSTASAISFPL